MPDTSTFQHRLIAARRAAWQVFVVGVALQMLTYSFYLALGQGGIEGLIETGLYGDIAADQALRLILVYVAALKLMNTAILMVALFLTFWVRALRGR
jgi:hypothetical protein